MATTAPEHPSLDEIRQGIKNRILDIQDEERSLETERRVLERAQSALAPGNAPKRPGRKPRQAA